MDLIDINKDKPEREQEYLCKCPKCGYSIPKTRDILCESVPCPRCGAMMRTV